MLVLRKMCRDNVSGMDRLVRLCCILARIPQYDRRAPRMFYGEIEYKSERDEED